MTVQISNFAVSSHRRAVIAAQFAVFALAIIAAAGTAYVLTGWPAAAASGFKLVMVEERGCRYCLKWDAEVGRGYAKSAEGKSAPLVRVRREAKVLQVLKPVIYTPTFILMSNGGEVGRITGYPGADYFWEELNVMLRAAGPVLAN